ncbi:MAG: hypothetical protein PHD25_08535 [Bacteroidales bacterium]|nr:hypothetical protein [Bacteroidales bacterium]
MADTLTAHGFDPCFAFAVIFPELIRYSSVRDFIETRGLEVLYVQYGSTYADFSVGHFQMKPSFAEAIEEDILHAAIHSPDPAKVLAVKTDTNEVSVRRSRLFRLQSDDGQLAYLEAFLRIVEAMHPEWDTLAPEVKIQFYASAYQGGYREGSQHIGSLVQGKYFHTGLPLGAAKYSYADISAFYYRRCIHH